MGNCVAFLGAGGETSVTSLKWLLLLMAHYQDLQAQVYREIHQELGERAPRIEDRSKLHLTQVFLHDVQNTLPQINLSSFPLFIRR